MTMDGEEPTIHSMTLFGSTMHKKRQKCGIDLRLIKLTLLSQPALGVSIPSGPLCLYKLEPDGPPVWLLLLLLLLLSLCACLINISPRTWKQVSLFLTCCIISSILPPSILPSGLFILYMHFIIT